MASNRHTLFSTSPIVLRGQSAGTLRQTYTSTITLDKDIDHLLESYIDMHIFNDGRLKNISRTPIKNLLVNRVVEILKETYDQKTGLSQLDQLKQITSGNNLEKYFIQYNVFLLELRDRIKKPIGKKEDYTDLVDLFNANVEQLNESATVQHKKREYSHQDDIEYFMNEDLINKLVSETNEADSLDLLFQSAITGKILECFKVVEGLRKKIKYSTDLIVEGIKKDMSVETDGILSCNDSESKLNDTDALEGMPPHIRNLTLLDSTIDITRVKI